MVNPELYNIVAALAGNQPTAAVEKFKNLLDQRVEDAVRDHVANMDMTIPSVTNNIDTDQAAIDNVDNAKAAEIEAWENAQEIKKEHIDGATV